MAYTGMRPEEAAGLRLVDVDLDEGTVHPRGVIIETKTGLMREETTATNVTKLDSKRTG